MKGLMNDMQSFTFEELDERGQIAAFDRYANTIPSFHHHRDNTVQEVRAELNTWRFTEHGERVA